MRQKILLAIVATFAVAAMGLGVIAQGNDRRSDEELLERLAELEAIVAKSPINKWEDWKLISADVGLTLRQDDRGVLRARVYIRLGDEWAPVAVDGFSEVAPNNLLLQQ